jgi:hypothetical protein
LRTNWDITFFASKAHTPAGLMAASHSAFELFSAERTRFRIDPAQQARLAARLKGQRPVASWQPVPLPARG